MPEKPLIKTYVITEKGLIEVGFIELKKARLRESYPKSFTEEEKQLIENIVDAMVAYQNSDKNER